MCHDQDKVSCSSCLLAGRSRHLPIAQQLKPGDRAEDPFFYVFHPDTQAQIGFQACEAILDQLDPYVMMDMNQISAIAGFPLAAYRYDPNKIPEVLQTMLGKDIDALGDIQQMVFLYMP